MNEEQIHFKIHKKTSYKEQNETENKNNINKIYLAGISAMATIIITPNATNINLDDDTSEKLMTVVTGCLNAGFSIYHLKGLVESICNKINLQDKIDLINNELDNINNIESRGIKR